MVDDQLLHYEKIEELNDKIIESRTNLKNAQKEIDELTNKLKQLDTRSAELENEKNKTVELIQQKEELENAKGKDDAVVVGHTDKFDKGAGEAPAGGARFE